MTFTAQGVSRTRFATILVFVIVAILTGIAVRHSERNRIDNEQGEVSLLTSNHAHALQSEINRIATVTYALAALVQVHDEMYVNLELQHLATEVLALYDRTPVLLLAPQGNITQIFPPAEYRQLLGHNLLRGIAGEREARMARDTGKLTLAGPLTLVPGKESLVGLLPVFLRGGQGKPGFWGMSATVFDLSLALEAAHLPQLAERGYDYLLWRINPETGGRQSIIASSASPLSDPVEHVLELPNAVWTLSVAPKAGWVDPVSLTIKGILAALISLGLACLTWLVLELKRHRDELSVSELKMRGMLDNLPTAIACNALGRDARVLFLNKQFVRTFGYTLYDIPTIDAWAKLAYPEEEQHDTAVVPWFMVVETAIRERKQVPSAEYRVVCKDGTIRTVLISADILEEMLLVALVDITERKQDELLLRDTMHALRQSEERHRLFAENVNDVIWIMGLDGRFSYVSPSIEKQSGFTPDEIMRQSLEDIFAGDSAAHAANYLKKSFAHARAGFPVEGFRGELELMRKDGSTVWLDVTSNGMYDVDGAFTGMLGVNRDISERKRYERELEQARDAAETANRAKSQFLANMSHEIRTPMNAVLGLAQLLEKESLLFPDQREMVRRIRTAGRSLLSILNDILDFSKIEAGQLRIEHQPFTLMPLLQHLEILQGRVARDKGLIFSIEPADEPTGSLLGDSLRLEQILLNLLGNAVKFTEHGEVLVRVRVLDLSASAARLRFEVKDTGVGISPEVISTLFEPFSQADGSITRRFGGTGLGLSIARRLVTLMGGTIGVESVVGVGSTFWFEIPFERSNSVITDLTGVPDSVSSGPRLGGRRILVVDDSDINRDLIARALSREGAEVALAHDGRQALDRLREGTGVDAVLMDIQMPVMDGLTAIHLIRSELKLTELPVIAFTAGVLNEERQRAFDAGASDFMPKPVDLEELVTLLHRWTKPALGDVNAVVSNDSGPVDLSTGIPDIPGIDPIRAAETFKNDRKFFLELLGTFCSRFGTVAEQIWNDLAQGNRENAASLLHTLRGTSGNLGALALMRSAGELYQAIIDGRSDPSPLLAQVAGQITALCESAAPWLAELTEKAPVPVVVPALDPARLELLRGALSRHDMSSLNLFEELEPALAGIYGGETIRVMSEELKQLRFDEVRKQLVYVTNDKEMLQ